MAISPLPPVKGTMRSSSSRRARTVATRLRSRSKSGVCSKRGTVGTAVLVVMAFGREPPRAEGESARLTQQAVHQRLSVEFRRHSTPKLANSRAPRARSSLWRSCRQGRRVILLGEPSEKLFVRPPRRCSRLLRSRVGHWRLAGRESGLLAAHVDLGVAAHRLGSVRAREQLLAQRRPGLPQVVTRRFHRPPVGAGTSLVFLHTLRAARSRHSEALSNLRDELNGTREIGCIPPSGEDRGPLFSRKGSCMHAVEPSFSSRPPGTDASAPARREKTRCCEA